MLVLSPIDTFEAIENPTAPGTDRGKVCTGLIATYQEVLALPPKDPGAMLRYTFSSS